MKITIKRLLLILVGVFAVNTLTFFSPGIPPELEEAKWTTVRNYGPAHLILNIDSHEFMFLARNPELLLTPEHKIWQSRPGYIFLGAALSLALRPLKVISPIGPEYFGFLLLNAILLSLSVLLTLRLMGGASIPALLLPLALITANPVTRAFFWTPHLQMFNVFIPLLTAWLFYRLLQSEFLSHRRACLIGGTLGLCALIYGAFVITAVGIIIICVARKWWRNALACGALFALPLILWPAFVTAWTGSFYSHEIARYRQFVWMVDAYHQGALVSETLANLRTFTPMLVSTVTAPLLIWAALAGVRYALKLKGNRQIYLASLLFLILALPFTALMGYYVERLCFPLSVPFILGIGLESRRIYETLELHQKIKMRTIAVLTTLAYFAFWVVTPGPYA